jgi:prolyl 4-hydroxylase
MDSVLAPDGQIISADMAIRNEAIPGFFCLLHKVLTVKECDIVIDLVEEKGFVQAALYTDNAGRDHYSSARKSQRCIIDSFTFAEELWRRIQTIVPPVWKHGEVVVGLNERMRILKYKPGDEFKMHSDGSYTAPNGDTSKITVLVYLNEGYQGGFTHYSSYEGPVAVIPKIGSVILQDQALGHFVPPLQSGIKYALRTEVMYRPPNLSDLQFKEFTISV